VARRLVLLLSALMLALALAGAPGVDAKKKPSCKKYKEHKGCKLKYGMFAKGYSPASPAIRVSGSKGTHIEMGGDVQCPGLNKTWWFWLQGHESNTMRVGKTVKVSGRAANTEVSGTIKVISAKKAKLKLTVTPAPCSVPFNVTLKRKKKSPKIPRPSFEGYEPGPIL
jgi:hypothetical protein